MAIAAWLVWRQDGFAGAKVPLALFGVQLAILAASYLRILESGLHFNLNPPLSRNAFGQGGMK